MLGAGLGFAIPKAAILDTKGLEQPDKHFEKLLYANALATEKDIASFRLEGHAKITFPNGRMRMENLLDEKEGQKSNFVFWCDQDFPADISVTWDFYPVKEPGLCMLFFAAKGKNGKDIFDTSIKKRTGEYGQYHHGDINTFHISYFRRRYESERAFNICNLRKSFGFHMVAQGADPIPSVIDATPPYNIKLVKYQKQISFFINDLPILNFQDDGKTYGPLLYGGKIGFRQMAPLIAEYSNFKVFSLK
ncbi:MAG TPA: DUF1961 family protein [Sphingobacteriaceae bacterium]|nr:DUF1961 family protein [Sphingobacteriaceae bacterium]